MEKVEAVPEAGRIQQGRGESDQSDSGNSGGKSGKTGPAEFCLPVKSEEQVLDEQAQLMRAGVYELLSSLLASAPQQELLEALSQLEDVSADSSEIAMGWTLLKQAAMKTSRSEVEDEFFALFVGLGRGELVPFGSWYMTGYLMEKPLAVLRRDLTSLGIEREEGIRESEDHIAALCDAMAILIRNRDELGAAEALAQQQKFYKDHLEPWAKTFFSDLQHADSAHFYRAVGFFGESITKFESEYFAMQA